MLSTSQCCEDDVRNTPNFSWGIFSFSLRDLFIGFRIPLQPPRREAEEDLRGLRRLKLKNPQLKLWVFGLSHNLTGSGEGRPNFAIKKIDCHSD